VPPPLARRLISRVVGSDRDDWNDVPGLSNRARAALAARAGTRRLLVVDRRRSQLDPFVKYR